MSNTRTVDVLEHWFQREQVTLADYKAAKRLRLIWEDAARDGVASPRYDGLVHEQVAITREHQARRTDAVKRIEQLLPLLGETSKHVTIQVVCRGRDVGEAAAAWGLSGPKEVRLIIRRALQKMADHQWGTERERIAEHVPEMMAWRGAPHGPR